MPKIAVLPGDGIGTEIMTEAVKVLKKIGEKYQTEFELEEGYIGGIAYDKYGNPFPEETLKLCKSSDAVLMGAVGGPKWDDLPGNLRPEAGLLAIRKSLELYANLRPAFLFGPLVDASALKKEVIQGIDIMVVRELTGGLYFGKKERTKEMAYDTMYYSREEIVRIVKLAFEIAKIRRKKVVSVDKANVLESGRLWREVVLEVAKDYPDIALEHMYVDNCAMQLVRNPQQFDVIVTENTFGDILSDEASMLTGSIGMLPSASLGAGQLSLYEPVHGSAPDIAGQNKANPIATILSVAMMLRYSFKMEEAARDIEAAIAKLLDDGYRTGDIMEEGKKLVNTQEMGDLVVKYL
ncbi:MAG: 3-isopropylmalate dehydrogenase [bacterium]